MPLSIAPSLELKQFVEGMEYGRQGAINRTIFGIETLQSILMRVLYAVLSIAPSLELKHSMSLDYVAGFELSIAPSLELKQKTAYRISNNGQGLSIAPSLELKRSNNYVFKIEKLTINRTIFGIETVEAIGTQEEEIILSIAPSLELKHRRKETARPGKILYQSHHLWN